MAIMTHLASFTFNSEALLTLLWSTLLARCGQMGQ